MNHNEHLVFKYIKHNPFISQQDLSEKVGLSRSSVANIISGLVKDGYLKGKAYVVNDVYPIVCIGAANVDRKFYYEDKLIEGTSNPVKTSKSVGGVARNIAENLGRMDEDVALITACGNDSEWETIRAETSSLVMMDDVHQVQNASTGSYTAIIDYNGSMTYGFADMDVYDALTPDILLKHTNILSRASCIIVDSNIPKESIEFLHSFSLRLGLKMVVIPVSGPKMKHLPEKMNGISWMIVNKDETESFFNINICSERDMEEAAHKWNQYGAEHVIVTDGSKSLIYSDGKKIKKYDITPSKHVVDVTGAGDAFSAAVIYGWLSGKTVDESIKMGLINSRLTIESHYTVRHDLSKDKLLTNLEAL